MMSNQYWIRASWVILASVLLVAGCERGHERQEEMIGYNPLADANVVIADYALDAMDAAGGRRAWTEAKKLAFDCVVTFYRGDGSFYLTEQRHEIHPWLNSIRIIAAEPEGNFVWQLSKGKFSTLEGAERVAALPIKVCEPYFAEAILDIMTAPARFSDTVGRSAARYGQVKLEGQWYYPIRMGASVWYQNRDSSLIDVIRFADSEGGRFLVVRGYDYQGVKRLGILVPTKIEVYNAEADGSLKERLARVDYYNLNQG
ncbi:MAG TPA: hypothetical protein VMX13_18525 [Sedimentisphaerales bacterium]|nr:hypothetical protein [Sedimentisphaerales bacterium]